MTDNSFWMNDRIGAAERGENPMFVAKMATGLVFLHDAQFLPGWCVLWSWPEAPRLEDLPDAARNRFLADMGVLGRAVAAAVKPRRVNYAIYGNAAPVLHAHVCPRYDWEPPERVTQPIWTYPVEQWRDMPLDYDPAAHAATRDAIRDALATLA